MGIRVPAMRRQRERSRSDRAYVVINGRRHKLGVWGSETAERRYRELIAGCKASSSDDMSPASPPPEPPASAAVGGVKSRPTIIEVMVPFMRFVVSAYPGNDAEVWHYRAALRILKAKCGELWADEFGPRRLREVRDEMVNAGWSRRYINGQVGRLRRMFRWAVAEEWLPPHVHDALTALEGLRIGRTVAAEPAPVAPVDDRTVEATLPYLNRTVADMVTVQRLCGCRPGELCLMASEHIDRKADVWLYRPPQHKTRHHGKQRVIALGPQTQAILQKYLFSEGSFFPYNTATYRQAIRRGCDRAFPAPEGVEGDALKAWQKTHRWKPNQLRHTTATKVRAEHGIEGAQHVLGHSHADVTQVYAERSLDQAKEIARRMG